MASQVIGKKPRIPQTYAIRKIRNTDEDKEFCDRIDKRIYEWETKFKKHQEQKAIEHAENKKLSDEFIIKKIPSIILTPKKIYENFRLAYEILNKKQFEEINPYSNIDEPHVYVFTLIYYFLKDERFFKSPLLRKDLSEPSFDKGTLTIGGYGCGKTSTWNALLYYFSKLTKYVKEKRPENQQELTNKFTVNKCVSSEIVSMYDLALSKIETIELMRPLLSYKSLYIDDIMREKDANNFGKNNIFLGVLTNRADRNSPTHLTMNPIEKKVNGKNEFEDTEESLLSFKNRYDGRIHDRIFGNYNIIELKSKSFRR
ncbi:MAG: hypothetical protein QM499_00835 [Flavobacteriaceae bacterium]